MSILVVGSIALDSVQTPRGRVKDVLGGSASYFSFAASFFSRVNLVAVAGRDFPEKYKSMYRKKGLSLCGFKSAEGKTFRWSGKYSGDMNEAVTLSTCLNVFETFKPEIPEVYRKSRYVFLANIDPELQLYVLKQMRKPEIIAMDTMNFWISGKRRELGEVMKRVDILFINENECRMLSGENDLMKASGKVLKMGPGSLVIKRGSAGVMLVSRKEIFAAAAYPLGSVCDPTGAGDSFAGGFMGFLTKSRDMRKAAVMGTIMASFCIERFSVERLYALDYDRIKRRYKEYERLTRYER